MFAIILRYKVPVAEVERHIEAHRHWLAQHYAAKHFLLAGRQQPRTGGFILAAAMKRGALDDILRADPFHANDLADYDVIEVIPTTADDRLAFLVEG